jgi:hypothetical protein
MSSGRTVGASTCSTPAFAGAGASAEALAPRLRGGRLLMAPSKTQGAVIPLHNRRAVLQHARTTVAPHRARRGVTFGAPPLRPAKRGADADPKSTRR